MCPEDIVLIFRFKDEEEHVGRYIANNMQFCSCFIAIDDNSATSVVYDKLSQHPKCAAIVKKRDKSSYNELCDREVLFSLALTTGKTFALYLDLDEALDKDFAKEMYTLPDADIYMAPIVHLYPDEHHCIIGGIYTDRRLCFMAKIHETLHYDRVREAKLHCRRFPMGQNEKKCKVNSTIYHYGMASEKRRFRRWNFYQERDPDGKYQEDYSHLLDKHRFAPIEVNIDEEPTS